jgi:hypothetical protein
MGATGKYIHNSNHSLNVAASSTYATARRHLIPLNQDISTQLGTTGARARLSGLYILVDTIAAGATTLTVRLTRDAAGDLPVIGDTTATISTGVTTTTQGGVTYKIDVDYAHTDANLYLFWKTDAGTCNVRTIELTWEE